MGTPNSEVYIGKNGVGKSDSLRELSKNQKNSFLLKFSSKEDAPDSYGSNIDKTTFIVGFKKWLEEMLREKVKLDGKKLKEIREKAEDKIDLAKFEKEIKKLKDVPRLKNFFKEGFENFITENKESEASYRFVEVNDLRKTFGNFGTGIYVYLMIRLIFIIFRHLVKKPFDEKENYLLIIDEPENFLHPSLIREVAYMLRRINERIGVVVATHSSEFLNYFATSDTKIKFLSTQQEVELFETGKKMKKSDFNSLNLSEFRKIKINNKKPVNVFDRQKVFEVLMASKIIFVEGENDKKLIDYILQHEKSTSGDIYVWCCKGKWNISDILDSETFWEVLKKRFLSLKRDIFVLYDEDNFKNNREEVSEKIIEDLKNRGKNLERHHAVRLTNLSSLLDDLRVEEGGKESYNAEIESKCKKLGVNKFSFKDDLEKYFGIEKKKKDNWDPETFFENNDKQKKLDQFLEKEGKLKEFLQIN